MPSLEELKTVGLVVGILLQIAGFAVLIYQLAQLNKSIRVSAQTALYQQSSSIRSILVERPELRKYLFDGQPVGPESEDYQRAQTVAEMFLNYLEHLMIQQENLRTGDWEAWNRFVSETLAGSPLMQEILRDRPDFYSDDLIQAFDDWQQERGAQTG
ncbi:MAG: hypothetical protein P8076_01380 [Gammaproteobacteria bacterium]